MNRKQANKIFMKGKGPRATLVRQFHRCHPMTVVEALVIWAQLPDCPPKISDKLETLREEINYLPEFRV